MVHSHKFSNLLGIFTRTQGEISFGPDDAWELGLLKRVPLRFIVVMATGKGQPSCTCNEENIELCKGTSWCSY